MRKSIMDLIVERINEDLTKEQKANGEKWERCHSEPYQIVQTEKGTFHNPIKTSTEKGKINL